MVDKIIQFSITNKLFVGITILFLIIAGIYSLTQVPVDAVPDITNNQVQVVTIAPSLAPQEVEKFITYPVEIAMANILKVIEIRSISRFGLSVVTVVFEDNVPVLDARQLVNEQIQLVAQELPEAYGTPELMPVTTGLGEIYQYTLEVAPGYQEIYSPMELRTIQDWIVKRQLSGIPGIVEISSFGGFLKQYEVAVNPQKLLSHRVSFEEVYTALEKNNQNTGGSYIEKQNNAYYVRADGILKSLEDIENIVVRADLQKPLLIKDIANVGFGHAKRFGAMTKNGKGEAVGGITLMLKGANSSAVTKRVEQRVEEVQKMLPEGVYIKPYLDRALLVDKTIGTVTKNLLEGGLIVIFVLILLLGNYRAGLIVASVIPLSLLFAFIMMHIFGVSANLMSLGAIDFGIVVDGAVIIVEGIVFYIYSNYRGQTLSQDKMDEIVYKSTAGIYKSAAFGVIIIIIVFFPILSLVGIEGKTFRPMAQTVIFTIVGALLLSITYVPMITTLVLKKKIVHKKNLSDKVMDFLKSTYKPVLDLSLRYKYTVLSITAVAFLLTVLAFSRMGGEFLPTLEEGDLAMQMTLPPGSSLDESIEISTRAEKVLLENFPEVEQVVSKIGTAEVPTDPMAIEDADIMIILKEKGEWVSAANREDLIKKMKNQLQVITGASFDFTQPIQLRFNELMTGAKSDIAIKIFGEDMDVLFRNATRAAALIEKIPGAADVKVEQTAGLPQLVISYKRNNLARHGISIDELNGIVRAAWAGEVAGYVFEGERKFDLVLRMDENNRKEVNLSKIFIKNSWGEQIPFSELAEVNYLEGPAQISRDDTRRRIIVGVNVRNQDVETLVNDIRQVLESELSLPPNYYITYGGQFKNLEHAKKRLGYAIPAALALIMLLLFFTFHSIKYALLIFTAVPLASIGGVAALLIRSMPFSISAGVGFIALFGVAVLNGIVLITYYNQLEKKGLSIHARVRRGALQRLRPVMMTALVASLGFLPMALSTTAGAEVQKPLATVVIGGLVTSTLLTMLILPILYVIFNSPLQIGRFTFHKSLRIILPFLLLITFTGKAQQTVDDEKVILSLDQAVNMALQNHPEVKNANLDVQLAKALKSGAIDLPATSATYTRGQINSALVDQHLEISQEFGSLPQYFLNRKTMETGIEMAENLRKQITKQVTAEVKKSWYNWIFLANCLQLVQQQDSLYAEFLRIAALRHKLGATSLLELTLAETKVATSKNVLVQYKNNLHVAENMLKTLLLFEGELIIPELETSLYAIAASPGEERFPGGLHMNYYLLKTQRLETAIKAERAGFFPSFSAGYFNQEIDQVPGFEGWMVGISVPVWFFPIKAKVQHARIKKNKAVNEYVYYENAIQNEIQNLILQLDNQYNQILHYQQNMLRQADVLVRSAGSQLANESIDYLTYMESISAAIEIQMSYLEVVNGYNQTAIQLEQYIE